MADERAAVRSGGEQKPAIGQGGIVGYDSNRVMHHATSDKIGILAHKGTNAANRPCQGVCVLLSLPREVRTPQKGAHKDNSNRSVNGYPETIYDSITTRGSPNEANLGLWIFLVLGQLAPRPHRKGDRVGRHKPYRNPHGTRGGFDKNDQKDQPQTHRVVYHGVIHSQGMSERGP